MIYSRNYARMFVTLKQESSDYSSDFKEAMGRCVIEVRFGKGRLSTYIQGLKKGDYSILFISCKNGNNIGVNIGKICTDSSGKGELKSEFDPENICGTNLKIEDFHVVAVMPFGNTTNKALLTGYVGGIVQWKDGFSVFSKNDSTHSEKKESITFNSSSEDLFENKNDNISEEDNSKIDIPEKEDNSEPNTYSSEKQDCSLEENISPIIDSKKENNDNILSEDENNKEQNEDIMNILKQGCICEEESKEKITVKNPSAELGFEALNKAGENFSDIIKKFKQGIEKIEELESISKTSAQNHIVNKTNIKETNYGINYIFDNNIKMTPFQNQKKDVVWVRIDLSELIVLPGKMWLYLNNPFVSFSEKKYKHLILGKFIEGGKEKYILGVPGKYFSDYRLEAGLQGFKQFKCCENKLPSDGDYGYWLLNINQAVHSQNL